jgi:hypothetical protein
MIYASGPFSGPRAAELRAWLEEHMPDLDRELGPMGTSQVRDRLNKATGLDLPGSGSIEEGCALYMATLKAQHKAAP